MGTGRILRDAVLLGFINSDSEPVAGYQADQEIFITIQDEDENSDSSSENEVEVVITNVDTGDSETISLIASSSTGSIFTGSIFSQTSSSSVNDEVLQYSPGDNLRLTYVDAEDGTDTITTELLAAPVVWDGGVEKIIITQHRKIGLLIKCLMVLIRVRFDDTSSKICVLDQNIEVRGFEITSAYAGSIGGSFWNIIAYGPVTWDGGTITGFTTWDMRDRFTRNAGVATVSGLEFSFDGVPLTTLGGPGLSVSNVNIEGSNTVISLAEDVLVNSSITVSGTLEIVGDLSAQNLTTNGSGSVSLSGGSYTIGSNISHSGTDITSAGDLNIGNNLFINSSAGAVSITGEADAVSVTNRGLLTIEENASLAISNQFTQNSNSTAELRVLNGAVLDALTTTTFSVVSGKLTETGTGRIARNAEVLEFVDSSGNTINSLNVGSDQVFLSLLDRDANKDAAIQDTAIVLLRSPLTGDEIQVTLTESTNTSGLFRNLSSGIDTIMGAPVIDSILQMTAGENLVVTYTDAEDNLDTISSLLDPVSAINLVLDTGEVSPTSAEPIVVTATFSSSVTGFTIEDVSVVNGTASNLIGSGGSYSFDVSPSSDGLVQVFIAAGAAFSGTDPSLSDSLSRVSDTTSPAATILPNSLVIETSPISYQVTFTETVVGFEPTEVAVTNGVLSNFAGTAESYTFDVTPSATGTVNVTIAAGAAADLAGNQMAEATSMVTYDPPNNIGISQAQFDALVDFYNATGGPDWTDNTGWTSETAAAWFGVTVTSGNVTEIRLSNNNVTGALNSTASAALGLLPNLTVLDLSDNAMTGVLPPFDMADGFPVLQTLDLSRNQFTGNLPEWPSVTTLSDLSLSGNRLIGTIPISWSLISLSALDISFNGLAADFSVASAINAVQSGWQKHPNRAAIKRDGGE